MPPSRYRVLGVPVDALRDLDAAADQIADYVRNPLPKPARIVAINPEKVRAASRSLELRAFIESATLLLADGIGVVMALRYLFGVRVKRVAGSDMTLELCRRSPESGHSIYIFGASAEVNSAAVEELRRRFPGIRIAGNHHGYVGPADMQIVVDGINAANPDILFVALGSPSQELWMAKYLPGLNVRVCQGIGGTLDTIVGTVKRAPLLFQRLGLEWFYRLIAQPSRIRRQYALPVFAWQVVREKFRKH